VAEKVYESMFIFNANAYARNPAGAGNAVKEIVESAGGELLASRMWNEQKLAYPINGQRKGVYWLTYMKLDGDSLPKFNRSCKLNDIIIRHLVVSIDPRLVDPLVAAANETRPAGDAPADKKDDKKGDAKGKKEEDKPAEKKEAAAAE